MKELTKYGAELGYTCCGRAIAAARALGTFNQRESLTMPTGFGREICGDLSIVETREWLVTNGIGGYGSGSVAGSITRGYHGLLVAAVRPPVDRRIMLVKFDEKVTYRGTVYDLATNRWGSGVVSPEGYKNIQRFELNGSVPVWTYACADALIEKRVWMKNGANTTYITYALVRAAEPVQISVSAIVDNRVFHNTGSVAWPATASALPNGVRLVWGGDALPLTIRSSSGTVTVGLDLYSNFYLPAETARGLNDHDSHVHAATFNATIVPGATIVFLGSAEADAAFDDQALQQRLDADRDALAAWQRARVAGASQAPPWVEQMVLAAGQFIVSRPTQSRTDGKSIIAGYHWFEDWGRDTMISLPGLTLVAGRPEVAAPILRTFAQFVSQGMLPNRFPDGTDQPAYNTMDATLWYFQAIRACHAATNDDSLIRDLYPILEQIVEFHVKGTRFNIHVDAGDGLLYGGQDGVQLTWMDAIVNGRVITPRIGKPVEVNALWYSAMTIMTAFSERLAKPSDTYRKLASSALGGFDRFWNSATNYCFDVLDGPHGNEASLRPNQILAVSLPESPLSVARQRAVVDACAHALLTSCGLRSLAPSDSAFKGAYGGPQEQRDGAYHEGTVWNWLLGPFIDAHLKVYGDADAAMRLIEPLRDHLNTAGLGTISEIFGGDAPFPPAGCIAQAWSVAETLRSFDSIERFRALKARQSEKVTA
jgi:predicted glycogen debranching enzyme